MNEHHRFTIKGKPAGKTLFIPKAEDTPFLTWTDIVIAEAKKLSPITAKNGYDICLHFAFTPPKRKEKDYLREIVLKDLVAATLDALIVAGQITGHKDINELFVTKYYSDDLRLSPEGCDVRIYEGSNLL